jgi:hypothetical protein
MEWADQERIRKAIVTIHGEARYYEGLDMLCSLVGWKTFRCEGLYPSQEMDAWVRSNGGGQGIKAAAAPTRVKDDDRSAIEILQGAQTVEAVAPSKKRGWPKGKLRGPRKPKAEVIPMRQGAK